MPSPAMPAVGENDLLGVLGSDASEVVAHNASDAKYAAPEHLLFERNDLLQMAM
jgi:hypothetical protein